MAFEYVDVETAIARDGLRMVVINGIPSPWGEAAKGVLHIEGIEWAAVRLVYDNPALDAWAGQQTAPVAIYANEAPRAGWAEILLLAERLAERPRLIPADPGERALMFGLAHEILGEQGLAWSRRLQMIEAGQRGEGGFPKRIAHYLGDKYGFGPEAGPNAKARVLSLLAMLAARLKHQREAGSQFLLGGQVTAIDVYCAVTMAVFSPLEPELCAMHPRTREAFTTLDAETQAGIDPILLEHRAMMYADFLATPLSL